ncbi:Acg family FMN-binding oxidoreductase [Nocardioides marmotae]|uniref:Acg family FMN-binding oxidoreductase n=1 Tax=Nocardioides marmotae TaxID=2663857 RepID=UPI0012B5CCCF|nr:NAD(P)H nitroreductase [Nocardioides marmotae]MBC9733543.1 NAD(P)H nitroreductase [Nocardioides marmotae]MTB84650.1 NAD(P)H nitroreductase [Nocardioides marmotae]
MPSHATRTELAALVGLACRAPSVHNTQPWLWRVEAGATRDTGTVELYADPARRLPAADPTGRNLLLSCGAALHHLRVGAAAHGWRAEVERIPDPSRPDLLASVSLVRDEVAPSAARDLSAIAARVTDRRRFTSWPVPDARLEHLAQIGSLEGAEVVPLLDLTRRHRIDLLFARARVQQAGDLRLREEQRLWIHHSLRDGIPAAAVPAGAGSRFDDALLPDPSADPADTSYDTSCNAAYDTGLDDPFLTEPAVDRSAVATSDGMLIVSTPDDGPLDQLRAGEALSALWLRATTDRLSVVPLSQVIEVEETREALRHQVLDGTTHPQLVVRLGWQEIARSTLPRTPRRDLDDVLLH